MLLTWSLHTAVLSPAVITGSGSTVSVMSTATPSHDPFGVTLYTTVSGADVWFVNLSLAIAAAGFFRRRNRLGHPQPDLPDRHATDPGRHPGPDLLDVQAAAFSLLHARGLGDLAGADNHHHCVTSRRRLNN